MTEREILRLKKKDLEKWEKIAEVFGLVLNCENCGHCAAHGCRKDIDPDCTECELWIKQLCCSGVGQAFDKVSSVINYAQRNSGVDGAIAIRDAIAKEVKRLERKLKRGKSHS